MDIEPITSNPVVNLSLDCINKDKQALVFVNTKKSAEKQAEDIAKIVKSTSDRCNAMADDVLKVLSRPTKQCVRLAFCLRKGIAFHHAGLHPKQREIVEDNFRNGPIKIICSTPTLAAGLDLPAFRTIIKDLKRFSHRGMINISVMEYLQQAGRAGRPKFDKRGESICIAKSQGEKRAIVDEYIHGVPEPIYSKLASEPALRTYLLSLMASGFVSSNQSILDFFEKTFWAYQFQDMEKLEFTINKILGMLVEWGFIISTSVQTEDNPFQPASEINDGKVRPTTLGKRVAELYLDPLTASSLIECMEKAHDPTDFSFMHTVAYTLEMRPWLTVRMKEFDMVQEFLIKHEDEILHEEPAVYDYEHQSFMQSVKTAMFLNDWANEKDDEYLNENYNITPGEIRAKLDIADWLLYASSELSKILEFKKATNHINKVRLRLKHGAKEELLPLLQLKSIGRVRARKLYSNKIHNLGDVKRVDETTLAQILGRTIAKNVKEQLGQEFKEPKKKGQFKIGDY